MIEVTENYLREKIQESYNFGYEMGRLAYKSLIDKKELFNTLFKVGTKLMVVDDFGTEHERILESECYLLGGHTLVAKFSDIGIYDIDRVRLIKTHKIK